MKTRWMGCALIVAATIGFAAGTGFSEDPKPSAEEQMKEMMNTMLELGKPSEKHEVLRRMAGDWEVAQRMWPGGKLVTSEGSFKNTMVLGGRFLHTTWDGSFMEMPHTGIGMLGHDNIKKVYQSNWYDSMSSGTYAATGTLSEDGKTLTLGGTWEGPGGMKMPTKMVYTFKDADTFVMEHFAVMGDKEVREMEMICTRAKPKKPGCCPKGSTGPGY